MNDPHVPIIKPLLREISQALEHRGPDESGEFVQLGIGLGVRRLSIIDIAGGTQPITNEDGSVVIVSNGEIYNFVELQRELRQRGHHLRTDCDTEVIVHLYEEMGDRCVEALNGMFSFALWDVRKRRLLLARDRLGEKPLYYFQNDSTLVFASELKALMRHPSVDSRIALSVLDDYLAYGYVSQDRCIISNVSKLAPGCLLVHESGRATVHRYWDVRFEESVIADESAWLEELHGRLTAAVRLRLHSDVPLGVLLSGGIDSGGITALAARQHSRKLKTFSVGFEEADFDELHYARRVADHCDTEHHEIIVTDCTLDALPTIVGDFDEPLADPAALPTYFLCREARKHVKVCLSGDGSDEIFGGYSRYRKALQTQRSDRRIPARVRRMMTAVGNAAPTHMWAKGTLQLMGVGGADRYFLQCETFSANERRSLFNGDARRMVNDRPWLFEPFFEPARRNDLLTTLLHTDQKTYLPGDILVKTDMMSMRNSLEVRLPWLDHTLVEFVNAAPATMKLRASEGKYAFKKIMESHLPDEIIHRKKKGFEPPLRHWLRDREDGWIRDLLLSPSSRMVALIDQRVVARLLRAHRRNMRDLSRKLWALLVLECWCRANRIS